MLQEAQAQRVLLRTPRTLSKPREHIVCCHAPVTTEAVEPRELALASPLAQGVGRHAQALGDHLQVEELGEVGHSVGLHPSRAISSRTRSETCPSAAEQYQSR